MPGGRPASFPRFSFPFPTCRQPRSRSSVVVLAPPSGCRANSSLIILPDSIEGGGQQRQGEHPEPLPSGLRNRLEDGPGERQGDDAELQQSGDDVDTDQVGVRQHAEFGERPRFAAAGKPEEELAVGHDPEGHGVRVVEIRRVARRSTRVPLTADSSGPAMCSSSADGRAVPPLPVIMTGRMPASKHFFTAASTSSRSGRSCPRARQDQLALVKSDLAG